MILTTLWFRSGRWLNFLSLQSFSTITFLQIKQMRPSALVSNTSTQLLDIIWPQQRTQSPLYRLRALLNLEDDPAFRTLQVSLNIGIFLINMIVLTCMGSRNEWRTLLGFFWMSSMEFGANHISGRQSRLRYVQHISFTGKHMHIPPLLFRSFDRHGRASSTENFWRSLSSLLWSSSIIIIAAGNSAWSININV